MSKKKMYQLQERTFVNADRTKVVRESDREAAWLLGPVGHLIDEDYAVELGLLERKEKKPVEDKSQSPREDKSINPSEDKSPFQGSVAETEVEVDEYGLESMTDPEKKQFYSALTILQNADINLEHLPDMLDADLLAIDGVSTSRLRTLRKVYPPVEEEDDASDDGSTDPGTL